MSKRSATKLEKILKGIKAVDKNPKVFISTPIQKNDYYDGVLERISEIEERLIVDENTRISATLRIAFEVFPLIDKISYDLYRRPGRYYLNKLGYPKGHSNIIFTMFRNGHAHNGSPYRLQYDDGEVSYSISSGGGSGPQMPYDSGYTDLTDPTFNEPPEAVFEYVELQDGSYHASLEIDRLLAHIKHDIKERQKVDTDGFVDTIIGQKIKGKRRKATRKISET